MQTTTQVNGVEVITRERARGKHPHPRHADRVVEINKVTRVLLADGTECFECDECGHTDDTVRQVTGHVASHYRRTGPMYDEKTLRTVLRVAKRLRNAGFRNWAQRAAAELNEKDVPTVHGSPWTAGGVSGVYVKYHDKIRVHVRATPAVIVTRPVVTASQGPAVVAAAIDSQPTVPERVDALVGAVKHLARCTRRLEDELLRLLEDVRTSTQAPEVDPVLLAKAKQWDNLKNLLGE